MAAIALLAILASAAATASEAPASVKAYIHDHLGDTKGYRYAQTDLNNDGKPEAVIYVTDPQYCGSGGCNLVVLTPQGSGWRQALNATVAQPPILVLAGTTHGWHDIGVSVHGGGASPHVARLRFDGVRYPDNPTLAPAEPMSMNMGVVLIAP